MTEKDFWLIIRRALLMIVKAIEKRFPPRETNVTLSESDSVSYLVDE